MNSLILLISVLIWFDLSESEMACCNEIQETTKGKGRFFENWTLSPILSTNSWSIQSRHPMIDDDYEDESRKKNHKIKKKLKKFMLPLLLAYKLKFMTLVPVMIGGLLLLVSATGLAGFFFALFAAVMGLKSGSHY